MMKSSKKIVYVYAYGKDEGPEKEENKWKGRNIGITC